MVSGLTTGLEVSLSAHCEGQASEPAGPFMVPEGGLQNVELILNGTQPGGISGIVVDQRQQPLRADVTAALTGAPLIDMPVMDRTGDDGRFVFVQIPPGKYSLTASMDYAALPHSAREVTVLPGQLIQNVRLEVDLGDGLDISGRVTNAALQPLLASLSLGTLAPGGYVQTGTLATKSDPDGQFRFRSIPPGTYTITARAKGYAQTTVGEISPGDGNIEITLQPEASVSGQVLDAASKPIPDYEIAALQGSMEPGFGAGINGKYQRISNPEGRFTLGLPVEEFDNEPASYDLVVRAQGYESTRATIPLVEPGDQLENVVITLEKGDGVRGVVLSADGSPVANANVFFGSLPQQPGDALASRAAATSDRDGHFVLKPSRPLNNAIISAWHPTAGTAEAVATEGEEIVLVLLP